MTPPTPARTHIWDGTRTLPDWLTGHHWTAGRLVIRTPDGDTRPQPGWWLIGWTDGSVTAATPTVAERVYGPDGIAGRLAHAETALARIQAVADDHPAGIDTALIHAELPDRAGPATAQATAPAGLRARIAHTLRTTPNRHATAQLGFPDHHGPSEGYLGWCALCTRDVEALTEALHAVFAEQPGPG